MCTSCRKSGVGRCWPQAGSLHSVREKRACQRCASKKAKCSLDRMRAHQGSSAPLAPPSDVSRESHLELEELKHRLHESAIRETSLLGVVDELRVKIDALEARVAALEGESHTARPGLP